MGALPRLLQPRTQPGVKDSTDGPPRDLSRIWSIFGFFRSMGKIAWDGPKWGREVLFPANPDLADILDDMDFDCEKFLFFHFLGSHISRFPGPRFPNFQKSGLGPAWTQLGPGFGPADWPAFMHAGLGLAPPDKLSDPKYIVKNQLDPSPIYMQRTSACRDRIRRNDLC